MKDKSKILPNTYCCCKNDTLIKYCSNCRPKFERQQLKKVRKNKRKDIED